MRLLLDTHALLWWFAGNENLSLRARSAIGDAESIVFVSAASAWEIATKYRIGKLPLAASLLGDLEMLLSAQNFRDLPISLSHAQSAGSLPGEHRDPFDRILIAQAMSENLTLVSNERLFDAFGVARLW